MGDSRTDRYSSADEVTGLGTRKGQRITHQIVRGDRQGIEHRVEVSTSPLTADGRTEGAQGIIRDMAERKQAEEEIKELQRQTEFVLGVTKTCLSIIDANFHLRFVDPAWQRTHGEYRGKKCHEYFHGTGHPCSECGIPRALATQQVVAHDGVLPREGNRPTQITTIPFQGENAEWLVAEVCVDITERKSLEQKLRESEQHYRTVVETSALVIARDIHDLRTAQKELEVYREKMIRAEHLASLGTLSAMLSHEMTQPLTVIRLSIQNALKSLEGMSCGPTVLEDLRDALTGVANASGLVERFRDFAGKMSEGTTGEVSLAAAARRVVRLLDESARMARITLRVALPDDLPPIQSYGNQIEQVFFLLAQNAVQAADGLRDHCFCIRGVRQAGAVELQFADDCGGIAPQILERVFEPFVTTKPPGEGTGLGLCVVQRIVSQVGGRLKVDSRWAEGTTFFLTLPLEKK